MKKANTRIAIVDPDRCNTAKCNQECKSLCPVNRNNKQCITIEERSADDKRKIASIKEAMCIGCGICIKGCPMSAINIIRLPYELPQTIHRYSQNSFKLCNLPIPRAGTILGLVGSNGVGKTSALQILSGKIIPNFDKGVSDQKNVLKYFRGTELQNYFRLIYDKNVKVLIKHQHIDTFKQEYKGIAEDVIVKLATVSSEEYHKIYEDLMLGELAQKEIINLSGGELQRFVIACILVQEADFYAFDEPSSFLDIKQRIAMVKCIRDILLPKNKYIVLIEHDLATLDYASDHVCCLYGEPGVYGIISPPFSTGEGINIYLNGFIPTDNTRFRQEPLDYCFATVKEIDLPLIENKVDTVEMTANVIRYPKLSKRYPGFNLTMEEGAIQAGEIICLLGSNGSGKSLFIKMLCGLVCPEDDIVIPQLNVSYKPQLLVSKYKGTVEELFYERIREAVIDSMFVSDIIKPLKIDHLYNHNVNTLSGGELQRVGIILALGKPCDVLLLDEPSNFLDVDQRLIVAKIIRKFVINTQRYCFLVEHDFIMANYCADRVIVMNKEEEISRGSEPMNHKDGFNAFLTILGITFRRDKSTMRPRINKLNSAYDREQKASGNYFCVEERPTVMSSFMVKNDDNEW